MARPYKEGIDYFPLDVDMDQDDKVAIIEAKHGIEGFAVLMKLLMKVYKEGYYYEWNEREQLLFSRRVNVDINSVKEIVSDCIEEKLFNKEVFEQYAILTSKGIQSRYLEAVKRRKEVRFKEEYFLLQDFDHIIGNSKTAIILTKPSGKEVNVNNNSRNDNSNSQSKVKESKGKESKGKESTAEGEKESRTQNPFTFFQDNFGVLNARTGEQITQWCEDLNDELVIKAMEKAALSNKAFSYANAILKNWYQNNVRTLADAEAEEKQFSRKREGPSSNVTQMPSRYQNAF
ncbi:Lin1244/Lin1753 domain-containing protein [Pontibacillus salipaludis]|uniref:DNA damage-inducible protein DnaD n=1 Tax=Pontibacillus salipaludis TaxID=1697394 RepID=A0ABQ1PW39_9BACI|nr:Lin1244/Lin1753 domain-containing protein [Pontibacillus salipaludis]GGD05171.1 DNA damage-inducible protein DnaD [Pontibacillus salipaludis]